MEACRLVNCLLKRQYIPFNRMSSFPSRPHVALHKGSLIAVLISPTLVPRDHQLKKGRADFPEGILRVSLMKLNRRVDSFMARVSSEGPYFSIIYVFSFIPPKPTASIRISSRRHIVLYSCFLHSSSECVITPNGGNHSMECRRFDISPLIRGSLLLNNCWRFNPKNFPICPSFRRSWHATLRPFVPFQAPMMTQTLSRRWRRQNEMAQVGGPHDFSGPFSSLCMEEWTPKARFSTTPFSSFWTVNHSLETIDNGPLLSPYLHTLPACLNKSDSEDNGIWSNKAKFGRRNSVEIIIPISIQKAKP